MKLILSICITFFLTIDVFGQNDTSSIFTKSNPERMILSFENSIDYAHLEKEGLAVSSIEICDYPSLEKDSLPTHYFFPEYIPRVDSIVSVVQSNEILSVSFIVYNTSHLIIDWDTGVFVMDDGLMKIKCIPFGHAMGHEPYYTLACITINFDKIIERNFHKIILNSDDNSWEEIKNR